MEADFHIQLVITLLFCHCTFCNWTFCKRNQEESNRNKFLWKSSWASCFWLKRWRDHYRERHKQRNATNTKLFSFIYIVNPSIIHMHAWLGPLKSLSVKNLPWHVHFNSRRRESVCLYIRQQPSVSSGTPWHNTEGGTVYGRWYPSVWRSGDKWKSNGQYLSNWGNLWGFTEQSCPVAADRGNFNILSRLAHFKQLIHSSTSIGFAW